MYIKTMLLLHIKIRIYEYMYMASTERSDQINCLKLVR